MTHYFAPRKAVDRFETLSSHPGFRLVSEAVNHRYSSQKMFLKISLIHKKIFVLESPSNKVKKNFGTDICCEFYEVLKNIIFIEHFHLLSRIYLFIFFRKFKFKFSRKKTTSRTSCMFEITLLQF